MAASSRRSWRRRASAGRPGCSTGGTTCTPRCWPREEVSPDGLADGLTGGLTDGLGTVWRGADAHFKYYPCAHVIQPYLDAGIDLWREHGLGAGDIVGGACRIAPWAAQIVSLPRADKLRPDSEMAAIASLPYLLAVALTKGAVTLDALDTASRTDPGILELAARLTHEEDPALGQGFDGVLILDLADGARLERPVSSAPPGSRQGARQVPRQRRALSRPGQNTGARNRHRRRPAARFRAAVRLAPVTGLRRCTQRSAAAHGRLPLQALEIAGPVG